jgi:hypothetical protein
MIQYLSRTRLERTALASQRSTPVPVTSRSLTRTRSRPNGAEALLDLLIRATAETKRYVPGVRLRQLSHKLGRTQVVNYAQGQSRDPIADGFTAILL